MRTWIVASALCLTGCGKDCGFTYVTGGTLSISIGDRTFTTDNPPVAELEVWLDPPSGFVPERPQGGWLERSPDPAASHHLVGYFSYEPDGDGLCGEDDLQEIEIDLVWTRDLLDTALIEVREVDGAFIEQSATGGRGLVIDQFAPESGTWTLEDPPWAQDTICVVPDGAIVVEWAFDTEHELDRTERCSG